MFHGITFAVKQEFHSSGHRLASGSIHAEPLLTRAPSNLNQALANVAKWKTIPNWLHSKSRSSTANGAHLRPRNRLGIALIEEQRVSRHGSHECFVPFASYGIEQTVRTRRAASSQRRAKSVLGETEHKNNRTMGTEMSLNKVTQVNATTHRGPPACLSFDRDRVEEYFFARPLLVS